jgi:hypothetical protein
VFRLAEIDNDGRVVSFMTFEIDDLDTAFEELNARYLVGEAAPYAEVWQAIVEGGRTLNRHEPGTMARGIASFTDHRRIPFAPGDIGHATDKLWALVPDARYRIAAVHTLDAHGAVVNLVIEGAGTHGNELQWSSTDVITFVSGQVALEVYDEGDVDAALARFDQLRPRARLENGASQVVERYVSHFGARAWDAMGDKVADDFWADDRRRAVNTGVRSGRDAEVANVKAIAALGCENISSAPIATRGESLVLARHTFTGDGFEGLTIDVVEINANNKIAALITFDPDDFDAALEELDARYVSGEAGAHAQTWSVVAEAYATFNRHEPFAMDWVFVDHRRGTPFASNILASSGHAAVWDLTPELRIYVEMVHRLTEGGVVVTHSSYGSSSEGFGAEWRMIQLLTIEGDRINRCGLFDEADIDSALARFDELTRPAPQLENDASRVVKRYTISFAARDWDAMADVVATDFSTDDRRRVVNAGIQQGRDVELANVRAIAEVGMEGITPTVIATRGERLVLYGSSFSAPYWPGEDFGIVDVTEINRDSQILAHVMFDPDDIDAAFAELDARYLAGEAAAHARTWSVIAGIYAAFNRHELPATTPDWASVDHRSLVAVAAVDLAEIRAVWDGVPELSIHIEAVHRLSDAGAVVTHAAHGVTHDGFDAEWRMVFIYTVEGDLVSHCEIFDEGDLDAALARFEELSRPAHQLENAASRVYERFWDSYAARDWDTIAEMFADNIRTDDRRRVVNAGIQHGRDVELANMRSLAEIGADITSTAVATRGQRLVLSRISSANRDLGHGEFGAEMLSLIEIDTDHRIAAGVLFDTDDIHAAFAELDARYLAGEAAAHANSWSVIMGAYAALNRRGLPATTPDWANIDHRLLAPAGSGDLIAYMRANLDLQNICTYVEAVHRLTDLGAVVTHVGTGTSQEGFGAEWRTSTIYAVDRDLISRCEIFDEEDIDTALARFDELSPPAIRIENAATRTWTRIVDACNRRDADGFLALSSADGHLEDRRKGLRASHVGAERRKAAQSMCRAPDSWRMEVEPVAIRGHRLGLTRERWRDTDEPDRPITVESLTLTEVTDDELAHYTVVFDPDDISGAIAELTARWIASGEVTHPEVIEFQLRIIEALNSHDWDALFTAGWPCATFVSHRQLWTPDAIADFASSTAMWMSLVPDLWLEPTEILTYSATGVVASFVVKGTLTEGVAIEVPVVALALFDSDRVTHIESFDPDQRELALARFEELNQQA